jgi:DnaJ-class molecular chaperone
MEREVLSGLESLARFTEQQPKSGEPGKEAMFSEEEQARSESRREFERRKSNIAAKEAEAARVAALEAAHLCPTCQGSGELNGKACCACNGTGEFRTEEEHLKRGTCSICYGTGHWPKPQTLCARCKGSGKYTALPPRRAGGYLQRPAPKDFPAAAVATGISDTKTAP